MKAAPRPPGVGDKELRVLTWDMIDWDGPDYPGPHATPVPGPHANLRIHNADTKGGEARLIPFGTVPIVSDLFLELWAHRVGPFVLQRNGKPIKSYRTAWNLACRRAGITRVPHDMRRTTAREYRKAGVSEGVIMLLQGWKTRAVFDRYNIIDDTDLAAGLSARYGKQAANIEGAPAPEESLS